MAAWSGLDGEIALVVDKQRDALLNTYRSDPKRLEEDANTERSIHEGAYAQRQLFELMQNAADAMRGGDGRCEIVLTDHTLYVANSGAPLTPHGVETLMAAHLSSKRDDQIGRFGLGFKSVLAVTDSPQIYSRSGSIGFDRDWSQRELSSHFPGQDHYPVARLARALDPEDARRNDPILDKLMRWATTVVVLPKLKNRAHLATSAKNFPGEFLLFSQHVSRLDIEDRAEGVGRQITLTKTSDGLLELNDAGKKSKWVVASRSHSPSPAALRDGGYQAARARVDVSWAAPVEGATQRVGIFWAYFPTDELTTLSGIVNAPWKLADDRERLLEGRFNDEILTEVLPALVASALPSMASEDRPAAGIDALPARGKESRGHADDIINVPVFEAVAKSTCIPSISGKLRHPTRVKLQPDGIDDDLLDVWAGACPDPDGWVHPAALNRERRPKILRLMAPHKRAAVSLKEWLEHLAKGGTVDGSAAAVRIFAELNRRRPELRNELSTAKVLLLEDGTLGAPRRGQVFLPGGTTQPGQLIIDSVLAADPAVVRDLNSLGIEILDDAGELHTELLRTPIDWQKVWTASRKLPAAEAERIFREAIGDKDDLVARLRVRTYAGTFRAPGQVFLPGEVIPADGSRDTDLLVDPRFHQQDIELLKALGLVSRPHRIKDAPGEPWRTARAQHARDQYRRQVRQPKLPDPSIEIDRDPVLWPLERLPELSRAGRAAMMQVALRALTGDEQWRLTRAGGGQSFSVVDPTWLRLADFGVLDTEIGFQPASDCIIRSAEMDPEDMACLPYLRGHIDELQAKRLRVKTDPSELSREAWSRLLDQATGWDPAKRFNLYAWAAYCDQAPPAGIKVDRGRGHVEAAPADAAVTADPDVHQKLLSADIPVMLVRSADDVDTLVEGWGLDRGDHLLEESVSTDPSGERYRIVDLYPPLKAMLPAEWHQLVIQPCSRIELLTRVPNKGEMAAARSAWFDDGVLHTTATQMTDLLNEVGRLTGTVLRPSVVEARMERQRLSKLRAEIAGCDDLHQKLVLAIGADALRSSVPAAALGAMKSSLGRDLTDVEIARLAIAVDGYTVLQAHSKDLQRNKLDPPSQWAGLSTARNWVRDLGFPIEFAGFTGSDRAAELEIDGPPDLGELHEYQQTISERIQRLFAASSRTNRGLVSLPTGAGKTRVAVQAIVEYMARTDGTVRIIWIAETDELCEQAVQTWTSIWRKYGRQGKPLSLSRLWSSNETNERDGYQVVVASASKLDSVFKRADWQQSYGWLRKPSMLVIDEAHRSIGTMYSDILRAIGDTARSQDIEVPLLGLTATPFRGYNERETSRLVNRYDRRLDEDVFPKDNPYAYLQSLGVLAAVDQHELEGADITLTVDEIEAIEGRAGLATRNILNRVESELGSDARRNNTIVESILQLPVTARVLLFATSVENARVLAALLSYGGVEARAVSAETSASARRRYIEDFRAGRVRVLTNYNVFTEGFDVPAVDAVYITRPTFSPNVYQQMVGRGLRGRLNGGSDNVLIVNVADNLTNYGREFAFRHFDHLWKETV